MVTDSDTTEEKRPRPEGAWQGRTSGTMQNAFVPVRVREIFREIGDEICYEVELEFQTVTAMPAYEVCKKS